MLDGDDSVIKDELTLPIDFERSGRMSLLGNLANSDETLMEECKNRKKTPTQPYSSMPDLSSLPPHTRGLSGPSSVASGEGPAYVRNLTPSSSGRPLSLKEYEQQLNDLKKENFNLKLRIYFLENKLPKIDGVSGEDILRKNLNLQVELEALKDDLERKEKSLQDTLHSAKRMQTNHARELEECREESEEARLKDREELIRCSSHLTALRGQFDEIGKNYIQLEAENRRLKEMIDSNHINHLSESDTEVSLLSEKERLIINLKTQIVQMERQMSEQKQKYEEDLRLYEEKSAKIEAQGNDVLSVNEPANQQKMNNFTVWVMQQRQDFDYNQAPGLEYNTVYDTIPPYVPTSELENQLVDLQRQLDERSLNLKHFDKQLTSERFELRLKIEEIDKLNRELQNERENGVKRDKTIQGLLKTIENERKFVAISNSSKRRVDETEFSLAGVSSLTDPSLLFADNDDEQPEHQQLESLKRRLVELETGRESLYERIRRVAEFLLQFADKLGGDAGNALLALSMNLSKIQDEFGDVSTSFAPFEEIETKLRLELSERDEKIKNLVASLNENENVIDQMRSTIESLRKEIKDYRDKLNADLNEKNGEIYTLLASLDEKNQEITTLLASLDEKNCAIDDLTQNNNKLENYGQSLKKTETKLRLELLKRDEKINNLMLTANDKETVGDQLTSTIESLHKELKGYQDKLNADLIDKNREISSLVASLEQKNRVVDQLSSTIESLHKELNAVPEKFSIDLIKKNQEISALQASLEEKNRVIDRVTSTVESSSKERKDLIEKNREISSLLASLEEKTRAIDDLTQKNNKLERYGKTLKIKYRKLETKIRPKSDSERSNDVEKVSPIDDEFEVLLVGEQERNVRLEGIVRQLEENNKILAARLIEHERTDGELKQEAAKVKSLTAKVVNYEKKMRRKDDKMTEI